MRPADYHLDLCIATIDARAGLMPTRDQLAAFFVADHPPEMQEQKQYLLKEIAKIYHAPGGYDGTTPVKDDRLDTAERELLLDVIAQGLTDAAWPSRIESDDDAANFLKALFAGADRLGWRNVGHGIAPAPG